MIYKKLRGLVIIFISSELTFSSEIKTKILVFPNQVKIIILQLTLGSSRDNIHLFIK